MEYRGLSVCWSACLSVTTASPVKTAEQIEMPFSMWTRVGPRNYALDPPGEGALLKGCRRDFPACRGTLFPVALTSGFPRMLHAFRLAAGEALECHIVISQWKIPPWDAASHKNSLTACFTVQQCHHCLKVWYCTMHGNVHVVGYVKVICVSGILWQAVHKLLKPLKDNLKPICSQLLLILSGYRSATACTYT